MSTTRRTKVMVPLLAVLATFALATPASAAPSPYDVEMVRGRISVGSTNFDTPGANPALCPGSTSISGEIDDTAGTITGEIDIISSDFEALFTSGRFRLVATGTSAAGSYDSVTQTFEDLEFEAIDFDIYSINTSTCVTGSTPVCSGSANLIAEGGIVGATGLPLSTGDDVWVEGAGKIESTSGCGFPWGLVVSPGANLRLGKNPAFSADLGAIFRQV